MARRTNFTTFVLERWAGDDSPIGRFLQSINFPWISHETYDVLKTVVTEYEQRRAARPKETNDRSN